MNISYFGCSPADALKFLRLKTINDPRVTKVKFMGSFGYRILLNETSGPPVYETIVGPDAYELTLERIKEIDQRTRECFRELDQ